MTDPPTMMKENTTDPPTTTTSGNSGTTASIVGGVLGAVLVLAVVTVLAVFFIWQRFFRKGLYEDDQKENAFDFSKTKLNAKNPIVTDVKAGDVEVQLEDRNTSQHITGESEDKKPLEV